MSKPPEDSREIWVLILEKAWAKVFGSYQRIEAGTAGEAFRPLTGCPSHAFIHDDCKDKDLLWRKIVAADKMQYPMATAVASMMEEEEELTSQDMTRVGLVDAHAYSLIGCKEITTEGGKKVRLMQVRNPWGKREWQGDWSDRSPLWTDHCKRQVDFKNAEDGCFWISYEDYIKFFYITTICYDREDFQLSRLNDEPAVG